MPATSTHSGHDLDITSDAIDEGRLSASFVAPCSLPRRSERPQRQNLERQVGIRRDSRQKSFPRLRIRL